MSLHGVSCVHPEKIIYKFYLVLHLLPFMKRVIVLLFFLPAFCIAQIPKPKANTYVNDYVNVLTADQVYQLNTRLRQLEDETTVQIAILLISDLPPNQSIEEYARTVGNKWKVGVNHNGIVYVAVLNEHKQRMEIAERLEGDIPDAAAAEIINSLRSDLQSGNFYAALNMLITGIDHRLGVHNDYADTSSSPLHMLQPLTEDVQEQLNRQSEYEKEKAKFDSYSPYIAALILTGATLFVIWAYRYRKRYVRENTINGIYIGVGSAYYASTHPDSVSDSGGGGDFGGFGGGGGGGFSGGGASGSW